MPMLREWDATTGIGDSHHHPGPTIPIVSPPDALPTPEPGVMPGPQLDITSGIIQVPTEMACVPDQTGPATSSSNRLLAALKDGLQEPLKLYAPHGSVSSSMTKLPTPDTIDHTDGHLPIPTSCGQCSGLFGKATVPACSQTVLLTNITDLPPRKEVVLAARLSPSPFVTPVVPSQPTPSLLSGIHYGESVWLPTSLLHALDF